SPRARRSRRRSARTGCSASRAPRTARGSSRSRSTAPGPGPRRAPPRERRGGRGPDGKRDAASRSERADPHVSAARLGAQGGSEGTGHAALPPSGCKGPMPGATCPEPAAASERIRDPRADGRKADDRVEVRRNETDEVEGEPVAEEPNPREDEEAVIPRRKPEEGFDEQLHTVVELRLGTEPDDDAVGDLDVPRPEAPAEDAADAERDGPRLVAQRGDAVGHGDEPAVEAVDLTAEGEERAGAQGDLRRLSVVDLTLKAHERRGEGAVTEGDEAGTEEVDAGAQPGRNRREDVREVAPELAAA